jgi:hypothetical protein
MGQLARDYQKKCIIYWQPKPGRRLMKPPPEKVSTKFYDNYLVKNKQQNTQFLKNSMGLAQVERAAYPGAGDHLWLFDR